jgi:acyl-CoA thioester hydrolase
VDSTVEKFEMRIAVKPDDIDQLGHVNNLVYLRWVQELAIAHWFARATEADQAALLWVVVRHEIDYKRPAFLGDEIIGRTWVGPASARDFERHTEFIRAADQKVLARARTVWCPIDRETGRPTEVSPAVRERFSAGMAEE